MRSAGVDPNTIGVVVQSITIGEAFIREQLAPTRFTMALLLLLAFAAIAAD